MLESWIQTHRHAAMIARAFLPLSHSPGGSCNFQKHYGCLLSSTWTLCKNFFAYKECGFSKPLPALNFELLLTKGISTLRCSNQLPNILDTKFNLHMEKRPALKLMGDPAHHPRFCTYSVNLASCGGTLLP